MNSTTLGLSHSCVKSLGPAHTKFVPHNVSWHGLSFQLEYLGEYEVEFEMNLGYDLETPCVNLIYI